MSTGLAWPGQYDIVYCMHNTVANVKIETIVRPDRVRAKDGLVRRFCSYQSASGNGDGFTTTIRVWCMRGTGDC
jgi:hypothetical protein